MQSAVRFTLIALFHWRCQNDCLFYCFAHFLMLPCDFISYFYDSIKKRDRGYTAQPLSSCSIHLTYWILPVLRYNCTQPSYVFCSYNCKSFFRRIYHLWFTFRLIHIFCRRQYFSFSLYAYPYSNCKRNDSCFDIACLVSLYP